MEIKGTVHCLFEQSGTFKNEFKKLGINAIDYDIQNQFKETDYVIDLFTEIENSFNKTNKQTNKQYSTIYMQVKTLFWLSFHVFILKLYNSWTSLYREMEHRINRLQIGLSMH